MNGMARRSVLWFCLAWPLARIGLAAAPAEFMLLGDWEVQVTVSEPRPLSATIRVEAPQLVTVVAERHEALPLFNPKAAGWIKGAQLRGVQAQETTTPGLLDPDSFTLRAGSAPDDALFQRENDYEIDPAWGTFGRTTNGVIKPDQAVFANYRHVQLRLDAVVLTRDGRIALRQGEARAAAPLPAKIEQGERHLGNIWLPGGMTKLESE